MNPPFTRPTGHEGEKVGVHNPMFAAFRASKEEQKLMGDKIKELTKATSAHGNAGEASIFLVLAQRKLKLEGVLALVMPLSLMSGDAWEESRRLLAQQYSELVLVSIAGANDAEMSFSADTDMGECLVVGRKKFQRRPRATFVVLKERPAYPMLGASVARQIHELVRAHKLHRIEDGPVGGTPLHFGNELIGQAMDAPLPSSGGWNLSRIADLSLAQAAYQLANERRLWLPTMKKVDALPIPINTVAGIKAKVGPYHADINGRNSNNSIRGPFDISPLKSSQVPTYPVLWAHEAENQRSISFGADSEGLPRKDSHPEIQVVIDKKVSGVWETASHCHFNRDFRFNSQSTSMQFTPTRTIGGRAWISIKLIGEKNVEYEKALVLWANTSMGLLLHWWHANKQQSGRGSIGVNALDLLPILDVTTLTQKQLHAAVELFDNVCNVDLLPFHEIDKDAVRQNLDERYASDVLGLSTAVSQTGGPLELLRKKLAQEPSIRGAK
jgi:hypothetical protein